MTKVKVVTAMKKKGESCSDEIVKAGEKFNDSLTQIDDESSFAISFDPTASITSNFARVASQIEYVHYNLIPQFFPPPPIPQIRKYIDRNREQGAVRLFNDYFAPNPIYNHKIFRRRFRMDRPLFLRVVNKVEANHEYFQQRRDATGRLGLMALQKCTAAFRQLAYGTASDAVDEYLRMAEKTARDTLSFFCDAIINEFGERYLRAPSEEDITKLLRMGERRDFPGMLGSIDCMQWEWKNCPTSWKGQFQGRSGKATLVLEAVASHDLWIWHSFFGVPGSLNDINVLQRSPVFDDVMNGVATAVQFEVNDHQYDKGYYLTDGIYPQWSTFIPSIKDPLNKKHRVFSKHQESCRKDVERAFGVLQARFAVLRKPSLAWNRAILSKIMTTCIILHNMIVEDERPKYRNYDDMGEFWADKPIKPPPNPGSPPRRDWVDQDDNFSWKRKKSNKHGYQQYVKCRREIRDKNIHLQLKNDLMEHILARRG